MIGPLLDAAVPRAEFADAVALADETLSVSLGAGADQVERRESLLAQLRVVAGGRVGWAGLERLDVRSTLEAALRSAAVAAGPVPFFPPAPSPVQAVATWHATAATLDTAALVSLARQLRDRLEREGRDVETWAERSVGRVDVGNSRGVTAGYDVSLVGYGADLRVGTPGGRLCLSLHDAAVSTPTEAGISALVADIEAMLSPPLLERDPPVGVRNVRFGPRAVAALLTPVLAAARAEWMVDGQSPLAGSGGAATLSAGFTLGDDPTAPGRPGSRPIDDEGVVCHRTPIITRGVLAGGIADLLTASRLGVPPSGHGYRAGAARARAGWSNLDVGTGTATPGDLAAATGEGILVMDMPAPPGNTRHGRVQLTTPWAFAVSGGAIAGRYERLTLGGNVFDWLTRIAAVSDTARWIGPRRLPELVVEGVEVA